VGAAFLFVSTKPTVTRQPPQQKAVKVEVMPVSPMNATIEVQAMGTVVPSRTVTLRSQVGGQIIEVAEQFTPGGRLSEGSSVLRIDPRDYHIEVQKAKSALARARADLQLERGKQDVAKEELSMFFEQNGGQAISETGLALRRPQLAQAQAEVSRAQADLDRAELSLRRTQVRAPFNALITERRVNFGSTISPQDDLATLVDTDVFWVEATVPLDRLDSLGLGSGQGRPVRIRSQSGAGERAGRTLRLTGRINESTRMAELLVEVRDPLGLEGDAVPLMLGDYVQVSIRGKTLENVFSLPRQVLREGSTVWLAKDQTLEIRPVRVVWKDQERVYIDQGLLQGDLVVRSELAAPVTGMQLRPAAIGAGQ
jgi:RND family efflux transporter MFP subunit